MFWHRKNETESPAINSEQETAIDDNKGNLITPVEDAPPELTVEEEDTVRQVLQELLNAMEMVTSVQSHGVNPQTQRLELEVLGEDLGKIIGRNGATLNSIQYLTIIMASKRLNKRVMLTVDANDYRQRRESLLTRMAQEAMDEVRQSGRQIALESMNAADRRKIHMLVSEETKVASVSEGQGRDRHVVIIPES